MSIFDKLKNINIQSDLVEIRAYQESDFKDLDTFFDRDLLVWFLSDYQNFKEFRYEQLNLQDSRDSILCSIVDKLNQRVFGVTNIYDIDDDNQSIEVGKTWIAKQYQGTGYNLLFKYYLFRYLIEKSNLNRVQLKADAENLLSVNAMRSVGLNYEGKLLSHRVVRNIRVRDTEMFSVTKKTWPDIKSFMSKKLTSKFLDQQW